MEFGSLLGLSNVVSVHGAEMSEQSKTDTQVLPQIAFKLNETYFPHIYIYLLYVLVVALY